MSVSELADVHSPQLSIEQIVITTTATETTVAASSLRAADVERGWLEVLIPFLDVPPQRSNVMTLAYIRFTENWAAVLGQHPVDDSGSSITHALVGQADLLTAGLALTLSRWPGWQTSVSREALPPLRPDQLRQGLDVAGSLRAQVLNDPDRLARVLGWIFQNPYAPLAVVGCPAPERVPLLWALVELGAPVCPGRPWTFWTEAHGSDEWWPDLVFLSAAPDDPGDRIVVDLEKDQWPDPANAHQANRLVFRLKYGYYPDRTASPPGALPPVVPAMDLLAEPAPTPTRETAPIPPSVKAEANRLAAALLGPGDATDMAVCLIGLERAAGDPDFRRALRTALAGTDHGGARVRASTESSSATHTYERIVLVMFGPGLVDLDTLSGADQAATLVRDVDDGFLRVLAEQAQRHDKLRQLIPAIGQRWVDELARTTARDSEPGTLAGIGRILGGHPSERRQGAIGLGALLLVVLAAIVGFAVGRVGTTPTSNVSVVIATTLPAATSEPATSEPATSTPPTEQATTTPPTTPPAAVPAAAGVLSVTKGTFQAGNLVVSVKTAPLGAGESLWLLEARKNTDGTESYYLQPQPCKPGPNNTQSCAQTVPVPAAKTGQARFVVVVRADAVAGGKFNREAKSPVAKVETLPAGAVEVARQAE